MIKRIIEAYLRKLVDEALFQVIIEDVVKKLLDRKYSSAEAFAKNYIHGLVANEEFIKDVVWRINEFQLKK